MDLKKKIAAVGIIAVGTLGIGHLALAATEIVASNSTEDSDVTTGDANSQNNQAAVVGQNGLVNLQDGDNEFDGSQSADSESGDGVNGQVIGAVGASGGPGGGSASIHASSSCEDCETTTGDANSQNNSATVVGQNGGVNVQEGDNEADVEQDASSESGDGVNGQVIETSN